MKLVNVKKTYKNQANEVRAINGISLDIESNGITMILGSSGCGKTTLIQMIAGRIDYEGEIEGVPQFDYLTQDFNLFESMSVLDNLLIVSDDLSLIHELLEEFSMKDKMNDKVKLLSNGEKKRIQFIRALLHKPGLLLCDEPTAALDHDNTILLMKKLKELSKNIQVIMVTHDTALAKEYGDRIIELDKGTVVSDEIIHDSLLATSGEVIEKKSWKQSLDVVLKQLKSEKIQTITSTMFYVLMILVVYTMFSLWKNIGNQSDYMSAFKQGSNMVVSKPNTYTPVRPNNMYHFNQMYDEIVVNDLFDYEQINRLIAENKEIIAVEGWYSSQYPSLDYELSSFNNKAFYTFTMDGVTGPDGNLFEQANTPLDQPFLLEPACKNKKDENYASCLLIEKEKNLSDYAISFYDLVNDYKDLPLLAGTYPGSNEVLLSIDTANLVKDVNGYASIEDLVGKVIEFKVYDYEHLYVNGFSDAFKFKVSGIANIENEFTNFAFFNDGFGKNPFYQAYVKDLSNLKMHYVRFILVPGCDYEVVANKINSYFSKEHVTLETFKGEGLGNRKEYYKSPASFMMYLVLILVILAILKITTVMFKKKRMRKEANILSVYGYSSKLVNSLRLIVLCVLASVISMLVITKLTSWLNAFAKAHYYQSFMDVNYIYILFVGLLACVISIIVNHIILRK